MDEMASTALYSAPLLSANGTAKNNSNSSINLHALQTDTGIAPAFCMGCYYTIIASTVSVQLLERCTPHF